MSTLRILAHFIKNRCRAQVSTTGLRKGLVGLFVVCVVYTFVYYSSGSVSTILVPVQSGRYHDGVQRNAEIYSRLASHTTGYQSDASIEGVTKAMGTEAMNIVIDSPGKTLQSLSPSLADSPVTVTLHTETTTALPLATGESDHEGSESTQEATTHRETLPQVLVLNGMPASSNAARSVQVLLESQRIGVKLSYYWKRKSPSLITEWNGKRMGSFAFVIVVDSALRYELWLQSKHKPVLDYCREYRVPLLFFPSASTNSTTGQEIKIGSNVRTRSIRPGSILYLELNSSQSWFYHVKAGLRITRFPSASLWSVFQITVQPSPDDHMTPAFNHTQGHMTSASNEPTRNSQRSTDKLRLNFEVVLELSYRDPKTDEVRSAPVLIQDRGLLDGVKKVYFGGPTDFWLTKLLLLDVMRNTSNQQMFPFGRQRWLQIDIDDIFIAPDGTKMTTDDVKVLLETQQRFRSNLPGMTFNLGFSGHFFSLGTAAEVEGNNALVRSAASFRWFGHIFTHVQPHLISGDLLEQNMRDNLDFAKTHSIPAFTTNYSVSPHHSGVYPVYQPLYDAWRRVWNVSMTTTEEYPHLRPDHMRRGFMHSGIMVLPRQTCHLFTHTYRFSDIPGGREGLLALAEGGGVFDTLLNNPVSIFMTHVMNYAHDRLALVLFDALLNFVQKFTQLELATDQPLTLGKKYFELFPEEKLPLWTSPCRNKRHLEIWPAGKDHNCSRLPSLLILGPQKSGTTALHTFLGLHPSLQPSLQSREHFEEVQFFSDASLYQKGPQWYMDQFPFPKSSPSPQLLFEKSATYFTHPLAPLRAHSLLPEASLVVILQDPVQRAHSWYQHARAHGDPTALGYSYSDVIRASTQNPTPSNRKLVSLSAHCLEPGIYHQHLERWLMYYHPDQLLLLDGGELVSHPVGVMELVVEFLGLKRVDYASLLKYSEKKGFYCVSSEGEGEGKPLCLGPGKGRVYELMQKEDREYLEAYYRTHNEQLMELLERIGRPAPDWLSQQLKQS